MQEKVRLEITTLSIVKVFLVALGIYFLFMIKDIIALLFIVLILAASLRPVVNKWEKKMGRVPAVLALLAIVILFFSAVFWLIIPPVVSQMKQLIVDLPEYIRRYDFLRNQVPSVEEAVKTVSSNFGNITGGVINFTAGVFGGIVAMVSAIIMTVYLLIDEKNSTHFLLNLVPKSQQASIRNLSTKLSQKVGDWVRGQIVLCLIMGVLVGVGLWILGVPYALTLGVIAALLELIPTIGPIISGIIAALIALQVSSLSAILVAILFIVLNQLENTLLVPKIMQKAVGLSPVVVILAVLIGARLLGIIGAVLAVPIAASAWVFIQEWPNIRDALKNDK